MDEGFRELAERMPLRLRSLLEQPPIGIHGIGVTRLPQKGVYVLFEGDEPIYVGRSNRLKQRLKEHSQRSSGRYSATLALRMAKRDTSPVREKGRKQTDALLMENRDFVERFEAAKDRIAGMGIRFVEIEDQVEQAMFEVYAALALKAKHNDFSTH